MSYAVMHCRHSLHDEIAAKRIAAEEEGFGAAMLQPSVDICPGCDGFSYVLVLKEDVSRYVRGQSVTTAPRCQGVAHYRHPTWESNIKCTHCRGWNFRGMSAAQVSLMHMGMARVTTPPSVVDLRTRHIPPWVEALEQMRLKRKVKQVKATMTAGTSQHTPVRSPRFRPRK